MALGRLLRAFFGGTSVAVDDRGKRLDSELSDRTREQLIPTSVSSRAINSLKEPIYGGPSDAKVHALGVEGYQATVKKEKDSDVSRDSAIGRPKNNSGGLPLLSSATSVQPATSFWLDQIRGRSIKSVLDLKPATGDRVEALIQAIVIDSKSAPRYATVGQFDSLSGSLSLIELHRLVRTAGGHLVPLPGSLMDGLQRLSRNFGTVDMVLLGSPQSELKDPSVTRLISRVIHANTLVFEPCGDDGWRSVMLSLQRIDQIDKFRKAG